jgi:hypothetical protein
MSEKQAFENPGVSEKLIFEKGAPGRRAATLTAIDVPTESL